MIVFVEDTFLADFQPGVWIWRIGNTRPNTSCGARRVIRRVAGPLETPPLGRMPRFAHKTETNDNNNNNNNGREKKHEKHLCRVLVRLIRQLELPVPMLGGRWRWNSSDTIIIVFFFGTRYIITRIILYRVYAIRLCVCYDPRPANGFPVRPSSITTCSYGITTPRFERNTLAVPTITRLYGAPTYLPVII